jgi:hypothetical protein
VVQVIRYKGFPLNPQEELCQKQFEALSTQPNNPEQLYTKMLELWSQLHNIKNTRPQTADSHWEALNENDTMRIANVRTKIHNKKEYKETDILPLFAV